MCRMRPHHSPKLCMPMHCHTRSCPHISSTQIHMARVTHASSTNTVAARVTATEQQFCQSISKKPQKPQGEEDWNSEWEFLPHLSPGSWCKKVFAAASYPASIQKTNRGLVPCASAHRTPIFLSSCDKQISPVNQALHPLKTQENT